MHSVRNNVIKVWQPYSDYPIEIGTSMVLRPRGKLNTKKIDGGQEKVPSCNKETVGKNITIQVNIKWLD